MVSRTARPYDWNCSRRVWRRRSYHGSRRDIAHSASGTAADVRVPGDCLSRSHGYGWLVHAKSAGAVETCRLDAVANAEGSARRTRLHSSEGTEDLAVV